MCLFDSQIYVSDINKLHFNIYPSQSFKEAPFGGK